MHHTFFTCYSHESRNTKWTLYLRHKKNKFFKNKNGHACSQRAQLLGVSLDKKKRSTYAPSPMVRGTGHRNELLEGAGDEVLSRIAETGTPHGKHRTRIRIEVRGRGRGAARVRVGRGVGGEGSGRNYNRKT